MQPRSQRIAAKNAKDGIRAEERSHQEVQSPRKATQPRKAGAEVGAVAEESNQVAEEPPRSSSWAKLEPSWSQVGAMLVAGVAFF